MDHHQSGSFVRSDNSVVKPSPFHGFNIQHLVPLHTGKQCNPLPSLDTSFRQQVDVSKAQVPPVGMQPTAVSSCSSQPHVQHFAPQPQQQQPCNQQQSQQQIIQQQQATSSFSQPGTMRPLLNTPAREQLVQAITLQEGISPAAQAALLQLVANMGTVESLQPSGPSNASQLVGQPGGAAPGSPIRSSSAVSSGAQLPPGQILQTAAAASQAAAGPAIAADQGNTRQQPVPIDAAAQVEADGVFSAAAAATAFAQHLPPPALDEQAPASPVLDMGGSVKLQPSKSHVTYKARALAAVAGAVRPGPAGSTLRLAGTICRSSSGSLADVLLNEAARAESGLMTVGLARSDSLPDMLPNAHVPGVVGATSGAVAAALDAAHAAGGLDSVKECLRDMAMLDSIRDIDLPITLSGLPSLSFIMEQHSDILHLDEAGLVAAAAHLHGQAAYKAPTAHRPQQHQQQQQQSAAEPASSFPGITAHQHPLDVMPEQHMPASNTAMVLSAQDPPTPTCAGRALGKPPSFTFKAAAALFSHQEQGASVVQQQQQPATQQDMCTDVASSAFATHLASSALHPPSLLHPSDTYHLLPPRQQQQYPLRQSFSALRAASFQRRAQQQQQAIAAADVGAFGAVPPSSHAAEALPHQGCLGLHVPGGFQQLLHQADTLDGLLGQVNQELMAEAGIRQYAALQFGTMDTMEAPTAAADVAVTARDVGVASSPGNVALEGMHWRQQQQQQGALAGLVGWSETAPLEAAGFSSKQQGAPPQQAANTAGGSQELVRYSRVITCKTYLKRLNITQPMAEHLLPYHNLNAPVQPRPAAVEDDNSPRSGKPGSTYELLFKEDVTVVDAAGGRFRVQYEGVSCNQQKHLRLTSGWRDYIRAHGVEVGDTIVFERRGGERRVLYASVLKGDGPGQPDGAPAAKRRRVSRAQAVKRLD